MKRSRPARWYGVRWTNSAYAIAIRWRPRALSLRSVTVTARAWRCAPTWTRFRFTRKPTSSSAARWTARCTRADTTATRRCCLARLACSRNVSREVHGTVKLLFQPAEEGGAGGDRMCAEGALDAAGRAAHFRNTRLALSTGRRRWHRVPEFFSRRRACWRSRSSARADMPRCHTRPSIRWPPRPRSSASCRRSCHARWIRWSPPSISVTTVHGGDAHNVIPQSVKMTGTVRSLSLPGLRFLQQRVREVSGQVAAANRCEAMVAFPGNDYPPVINDEACWRSARRGRRRAARRGRRARVATRDGRGGFRLLHAARSRLFRRARSQAGWRRRQCTACTTRYSL